MKQFNTVVANQNNFHKAILVVIFFSCLVFASSVNAQTLEAKANISATPATNAPQPTFAIAHATPSATQAHMAAPADKQEQKPATETFNTTNTKSTTKSSPEDASLFNGMTKPNTSVVPQAKSAQPEKQ